MSYLMTYVRRKGNAPRTVAAYDYDEQEARTWAEGMAALSQRVTLTEMDDDGIPSVIAIWENGSSKRRLPEVSVPQAEPVTIEGEFTTDDTTEPDDEADPEIAAAAEADDSGETHNAYCMKCHEKRDIHGEVTETENGRRRVQGNCPVCGSKVFKFLPSAPKPEMDDDEADTEPEADTTDDTTPADEPEEEAEPEADEEDADPEISELTEQVTEAISEMLPGGTTLPEVAAAVTEAAVAFSDSATEAAAEKPVPAKPAPRKRAAKGKAEEKGEAKPDPDLEKVKALGVAECPQCFRNVPFKVAGSTGLRFIMNHPDEKRSGSNCRGSGATVEDSMIRG